MPVYVAVTTAALALQHMQTPATPAHLEYYQYHLSNSDASYIFFNQIRDIQIRLSPQLVHHMILDLGIDAQISELKDVLVVQDIIQIILASTAGTRSGCQRMVAFTPIE